MVGPPRAGFGVAGLGDGLGVGAGRGVGTGVRLALVGVLAGADGLAVAVSSGIGGVRGEAEVHAAVRQQARSDVRSGRMRSPTC